MFFKKNKPAADNLQGKRIGILGLGPGNGVTHISVALSNYLADVRKKSVCLMEKSGHNDFEALVSSLGAPTGAADYEFHQVNYVCHRGLSEEDKMLDSYYDCTVFDLGADLNAAMKTLCICDLRIVVGTGAAWRRGEYDQLRRLVQKNGGLNNWLLFVNLGNKETCRQLREFDIPAFCFPCESDPVFLGTESISLFEEVFRH